MTLTIKEDFQEKLKEALNEVSNDKNPLSEKFFSKWFRQKGTPYFFLFKKNLSHTSMQYAEILALIRVHTVDNSGERHELHFLKTKDFIEHWGSLFKYIETQVKDIETQVSSPTKPTREQLIEDIIEDIIDLYGKVLFPIVAIELFFGSCIIFIPPHLKLHLFETCSESGYIHSCGPNVYTQSLDEAKPGSLIDDIDCHIKKTLSNDKLAYLAVYAHEDFKKEDTLSAADLRGGLDDTKIYVEKYYLGNDSFVSFLSGLKTSSSLGSRICIQGPGPFREMRDNALKNPNLERDRTLWLLVDRSLSSIRRFPGEERFIICYDQHYKNSNPFHIFDENKPAWVAHTTIPHKLAAAMINITRPWWTKDDVTIADPFAGSGTIGLECLKYPDINVDCSDLAPISLLLGEDNLRFFAYSTEELEKISKHLKDILAGNILNTANTFSWARTIYEKVKSDIQNPAKISSSIIIELQKKDFLDRLVFYLILRTEIRHFNALERGSEDVNQAYMREVGRFLKQVNKFIEQRKKEEEEEEGSSKRENKSFIKIEGRYSLDSSINPDVFKTAWDGNKWRIRKQDATDKSEFEKKADVIITDPPYGFNTDEDVFQLAKTYTMALRSMISRFDNVGQLVICLPDKSYTGKKIPVFATSEWLIQQILAEAQSLEFEAVVEAQVLPHPSNLFSPPYYWESERALSRKILHFRFRKLSNRT